MGYSIYLIDRTSDISSDTLKYVVDRLPSRLGPYEGLRRDQSWGYSMKCDVSHKSRGWHGYISVSGSFKMSGEWALDMVLSIQQILQSRGYKIEVYSTDFGFYKRSIAEWIGDLDDDIDESCYGEPFWESD